MSQAGRGSRYFQPVLAAKVTETKMVTNKNLLKKFFSSTLLFVDKYFKRHYYVFI
jgi:hypothetical protein